MPCPSCDQLAGTAELGSAGWLSCRSPPSLAHIFVSVTLLGPITLLLASLALDVD